MPISTKTFSTTSNSTADAIDEDLGDLNPRNKKGWKIHLLQTIMNIIEFVSMVLCGLAFAKYMQQLHETRLWFTNIKQVEKEISLRTESGLYYSYYKFAVDPDRTLSGVLSSLMNDTRTEYPHSVNILQRFNIYQELLLAFFYKYPRDYLWTSTFAMDPILFYVYSCFLIAGIGLIALQFLAFKLSKIRFVGILIFAWAIVNLDDYTRVFFTVNLRENFALPFLWIQNSCLISYIQRGTHSKICTRFVFTVSTFFFTIFWQFSQFILLLQSIALFLLALLIPKQIKNVKILLFLQLLAYLLAISCHFLQPMMIASAFLSFTLVAITILSFLTYFHGDDPQRISFVCKFCAALTLAIKTIVFMQLVKRITGVESDSHIWSFVRSKMGLIDKSHIPFDTALYICHGSFSLIGRDFFERATKVGCFPMYLSVILILFLDFIYYYLQKPTKEPIREKFFGQPCSAITYFTIQSLLSGMIAFLTLRMKYLWYPQIIVIGSCIFSRIVKMIGYYTSQILALSVAIGLLYNHYPIYKEQLANEQEFYDPDTVELMEWISSSTPLNSSWSGSMQLMAGIKACTNRNIANHPHFEDKWLRDRTLRLYQIYGRKLPAEVNKILLEEQVDYVIIEDSICLAHSTGCATKDLVDIANGDSIESDSLRNGTDEINERSNGERFCNRIRRLDEEVKKYFKLVFINRTFRIYNILK